MAVSFERIYRQNCHNLGLVTSTRLDLLPRILAGDGIDLAELCDGLYPLSIAIIAAGGLFPYSRALASGADQRRHRVGQPAERARGPVVGAASAARRPAPGAATLAEKILAAHAGDAPAGGSGPAAVLQLRPPVQP
jgi:hypothetical protein